MAAVRIVDAPVSPLRRSYVLPLRKACHMPGLGGGQVVRQVPGVRDAGTLGHGASLLSVHPAYPQVSYNRSCPLRDGLNANGEGDPPWYAEVARISH